MKSSIWMRVNQLRQFKFDYLMEAVLPVASIYLIELPICAYLSQRTFIICCGPHLIQINFHKNDFSARPQYAAQVFALLTTFPNKELSDAETIQSAGIMNATITQRLK